MELFDDRVVLFESDEGGEYLLVTCEPSGMGGLVVRQTVTHNFFRKLTTA